MLRALRELKGRRARKFMKMIKQFGLIKALRCAYRLDTYSKTLLSSLSCCYSLYCCKFRGAAGVTYIYDGNQHIKSYTQHIKPIEIKRKRTHLLHEAK